MKNTCECCGTCCRNGGPPLHTQDLELIKEGKLAYEDMITIRRGELVLPPMAEKPVKAVTEWIKIQGIDGGWCCRFLDPATNTCSIYSDRPLSCRVLKCWDTKEILTMAGQDLLCRKDLIDPADPLLPFVQLQEKVIPVPDMEQLSIQLKNETESAQLMVDLAGVVEKDLQLRSMANREYNLSLASELFYFGRPLFQLLSPLGIETVENPHGISLRLRSC